MGVRELVSPRHHLVQTHSLLELKLQQKARPALCLGWDILGTNLDLRPDCYKLRLWSQRYLGSNASSTTSQLCGLSQVP